MKIKELRTKLKVTQKELAEMLKTTQQTVGRWETGKAEPNLSALRDMAMIFGCSVDDLLGKNPMGNAKRLTTSRPYAYLFDEQLDGYWGNFGVLLPGTQNTLWFPISLSEAERIGGYLSPWNEETKWFVTPTLNNRMLVVNTTAVSRMWLLDEACDAPDDWVLLGDGVEGWPLEIYRGLDNWVDHHLGDEDWDGGTSKAYRAVVSDYIEKNGLTPESALELLHYTKVYQRSGGSSSYYAEPRDLGDVLFHIETADSAPPFFQLNAFGGDFESYFPSANVALIDMPLIDVMDAMKEHLAEYDDE